MKKDIQKAVLLFLTCFGLHAQQDSLTSNIQNYTPSKLLEKGKWDIKWFNNLFTQTKSADESGKKISGPRQNYFATSIETFTGISESKKFNVGAIIEFRSNTFAGKDVSSVFSFQNKAGEARTGISAIAPSIKIAPFEKLSRFSLQSSFFIPLVGKESNENGYLGNNSYIWQNRFFYDYSFPGNKFQLFSELSVRNFFGEKTVNSNGSRNLNGGYANNSMELVPGVFFSYFPSSKFTTLVFLQHQNLIDLGSEFSQNYTLAGLGAKYQATNILNIEVLYGNFLRGNATGIGQSFNLGIRTIF
jgi:hypothetical protein